MVAHVLDNRRVVAMYNRRCVWFRNVSERLPQDRDVDAQGVGDRE